MPRTKGSKNRPKTNITKDYATQIAEKQEAIASLTAEITSITTNIDTLKANLKEKKTALKKAEKEVAALEAKKAGPGADPAPGFLHLPPGSTQCHHFGSHWSRKDLFSLRPWHGCQPQLLFRPVYSPAGSAGGDLCGPRQRNLPGLHEKAQERETTHPG